MAAADASMAKYAQNYVEALAARAPTIEGKVRELVVALLPTGRCSLDRVAQHLGCDGRTVQRGLAERGSSFSEVLDAHRSEMVMRLIEDRSRSLPAVAELLGFSAQSALARWFRDRFGCSITQWRSNKTAHHSPLLIRGATATVGNDELGYALPRPNRARRPRDA